MRRLCVVLAVAVGFVLSGSATVATAAGPNPPKVGQKTPGFELPQMGNDKTLQLSDWQGDGPVVVVVLRGYPESQCPACSRQVGDLVRHAKTFKDLNAKVVFVYPGQPSLLEKHAEDFLGEQVLPEPFIMVRDPGMKMIDAWGLRWDAPRETSYPSTFVLTEDGKVAWSKTSETHRGRATSDEVLAAVKRSR